MIAIVDYGAGNLLSVQKAFEWLGASAAVTRRPDLIGSADAVVLPGVGAFGDAMRVIEGELASVLIRGIHEGKPTLGICLGLQLLFEASEESKGRKGLGAIPGRVVRLPVGVKVPHMGWSEVDLDPDPLFEGVPSRTFFYFAHSYVPDPGLASCSCQDIEVVGRCRYGVVFPACVRLGTTTYGVQFHPEKSGRDGLLVLRNFLNMVFGTRGHGRATPGGR